MGRLDGFVFGLLTGVTVGVIVGAIAHENDMARNFSNYGDAKAWTVEIVDSRLGVAAQENKVSRSTSANSGSTDIKNVR